MVPRFPRSLLPALVGLVVLAGLPVPVLGGRIATPAASPAPGDSELAARFDAFVQGFVERDVFSGAVLVAREGRIVHEAAYGLADRARGAPNTVDTVFQIASVTKGFTAMAILQLAEAGRLGLDDPIARHLPDFGVTEGNGVPITIRNLLAHTSGLPDFLGFYDLEDRRTYPASLAEVLADIEASPLEFTPGSTYRYSNSGYLLLGLIVERVAGVPFETYLRQQILDPLGMTRTWLAEPTDPSAPVATGYLELESGIVFPVSRLGRVDIAWAAGGLSSTVGDLYRWDRALKGEELASAAGIAQLFAPGLGTYGLGWDTTLVMGRPAVHHYGETLGFRSALFRFPDDDATIIVLSNRQDAPTGAIVVGLAKVLFEGVGG